MAKVNISQPPGWHLMQYLKINSYSCSKTVEMWKETFCFNILNITS